MSMALTNLDTVQSAPFKRLKMKHRVVIAEHLRGRSNTAIAESLGVSPDYISYVLNNPTVKPVLERAYSDYEMELRALVPECIAAIRRNLRCGDAQGELRAAELGMKANRMFDSRDDSRQTAEDVIERILERIMPDGSKVKITERRRLASGVLDVEASST